MMQMTDSQIIAKVLSHYIAGVHDHPELKDIIVSETKRTIGTKRRGWQVTFLFAEPDPMIGTIGLLYELDSEGEVMPIQTM